MSSKRGRKRNDNLPPNRARDVQRAFRARRAAHLQAMERRLEELEEENNRLRAALNLPVAIRPSLGKGPTGKDKPKTYSSTQPSGSLASPLASGATSSADSPTSSRTSSLSPSAATNTLQTSPTTMQGIDSHAWDQTTMLMREERPDVHGSPISPAFRLSSVNPPMSHKQQYSLPPAPPISSSSRHSAGTNIYIPPAPQNYSHTADRPMSGTYEGVNFLMRDLRDDSQQYTYSQPSFPPTPGLGSMHHHSSLSESTPMGSQLSYQQRDQSQLSNLPYTHRRSITEPLGGFRPNMVQFTGHPNNLPPPPQGNSHQSQDDCNSTCAGHNAGDARTNQMP